MTPGTQPASVSKNTIIIEPHPLSKTAKGGKRMAANTRKQLIIIFFYCLKYFKKHDSTHSTTQLFICYKGE